MTKILLKVDGNSERQFEKIHQNPIFLSFKYLANS